MSSLSFIETEARMVDEFVRAGHTSVAEPIPDNRHPLHELFLDTQSIVKRYCPVPKRWRLPFQQYRAMLHQRLLKLKDLLDKAQYEGYEILSQKGVPSNAELLALRFATSEESDNAEIIQLLTTLGILHLWYITPHPDTDAKMPETIDDAENSSTEGTPTEGDSNLEMALKAGLADVDRKVKAIQDAKNDLNTKLAMVEEAEMAVLQARDAMSHAQNAMAKADLALMQSPMRFLVEDS